MKPILFNTEMVRAILEGRKTVTRRVVKPHYRPGETGWQVITEKHSGKYVRIEYLDEWENETRYMIDPFRPGDILYVQETWEKSMDGTYMYKATDDPIIIDRWHRSIHMPKEAARLFLRVTDVRVERLQEITEEQALSEGTLGLKCEHENSGAYGCTDCMNTGWLEPPKMDFMCIWNSTIKKKDIEEYGWDANPWVWVIEFKRCEKPKEDEA